MRLAWPTVVLVLALSLPAAIVAVSATASTCRDGPLTVGFGAGAGLLDATGAELDAQVADAVRAGATWLRVDLDWSRIEPTEGVRDWSAVDGVVDRAHGAGLRVLALVTYTPEWARADVGETAGAGETGPPVPSHAPPRDPARFAAFAAAAAERYADTVSAWEVWNEPNNSEFWLPRADADGYARLLAATTVALRAHSAAPVLSGGLSPAETDGRDISPQDFLEHLFRDGAAGAVDGVAVHPYTFPDLPSRDTTSLFGRLPRLHAIMERYGRGDRLLWLTEFGAPTGHGVRAVDPDRQAAIIADGLAALRGRPWAGPVFVFALRDAGTDPGDREQNFGVLRADGTPKPAWDAVVRATGGCR